MHFSNYNAYMATMRVEAKINNRVASKNGKAIHDKLHVTLMVSF